MAEQLVSFGDGHRCSGKKCELIWKNQSSDAVVKAEQHAKHRDGNSSSCSLFVPNEGEEEDRRIDKPRRSPWQKRVRRQLGTMTVTAARRCEAGRDRRESVMNFTAIARVNEKWE
jgi:hypothetical protein